MADYIKTIAFSDSDSEDDATVIVRVADAVVGLTLSLRKNGDLAVFFGAPELDELISALNAARQALK